MNPNKLKRLFPHASSTFRKLNTDNPTDPRMSSEPEQVDRKEVCETQRGKEMGKKYHLRHVEIEFFAGHGRVLDQDNRRYIAKPILDAIVNIGIEKDDKDITSDVTQGMDKANPIL